MNLFKQLEDKKKELTELEPVFSIDMNNVAYFKRYAELKAEIAILEQAIAEMQKQRQEILDFIKDRKYKWLEDRNEIKDIGIGLTVYGINCRIDELDEIIQQLNQPKTEQ